MTQQVVTPLFALLIEAGGEKGEHFSFDKERITLGRTTENDLVLYDSSVSRRHASITREGRHFLLEDLQSSNGTLLNNDLIRSERRYLQEGDQIQVGPVCFTFTQQLQYIDVAHLQKEQHAVALHHHQSPSSQSHQDFLQHALSHAPISSPLPKLPHPQLPPPTSSKGPETTNPTQKLRAYRSPEDLLKALAEEIGPNEKVTFDYVFPKDDSTEDDPPSLSLTTASPQNTQHHSRQQHTPHTRSAMNLANLESLSNDPFRRFYRKDYTLNKEVSYVTRWSIFSFFCLFCISSLLLARKAIERKLRPQTPLQIQHLDGLSAQALQKKQYGPMF
ncbi:MAG: FHA domain-containing protein, partial [Myxococcota bacterium]